MRSAVPAIVSQVKGLTTRDSIQYQALCPSHADTDRSFGFKVQDDGSILLNCFAGCAREQIMACLKLTPHDIGPDDNPDGRPRPAPVKDDRPTSEHWTRSCELWHENWKKWPERRASLARALELPETVFDKLPLIGARMGRSPEHPEGHWNGACWTFPERDGKTGAIIGVQNRFADGKKPVEKGCQRGIYVPADVVARPGPLYVPEGVSDTLALTAAGLASIGRPAVNVGVEHVAEWVKANWSRDRDIVWLGEHDKDKKTRDASTDAVHKLAGMIPEWKVFFALPPNSSYKDVRKWFTNLAGAGVLWETEMAERLTHELTGLKPTLVIPKTESDSSPGAAPDGDDPGPDGKDRVKIILGKDKINQKVINDGVIQQLARDPNLYARGNMLVRIISRPGKIHYRGKDEKGNPRPAFVIPSHIGLSGILVPTLREKISAVVSIIKNSTKLGDREVDVPDWMVTAIHAREEWPVLKNLTALVDYPVLRPDGTMVTVNGHDPITGVYYNHATSLSIPSAPTRQDAMAAWRTLSEVVHDFPFEKPVHKSAWLAALLTPMARFAFYGCVPIFLIDGNDAGVGKGLLADTISLILTGRPFATMGYVDDQIEMSKRITAIAIEGEQLVMFDNIGSGFGGPAIDRALTSLEWSERILGKSNNIKCPLRVGWYGTGNNIEFVGDIRRRLCQIRLEVQQDAPEERCDFIHTDLRAWVMVNRDNLLAAAATILAAYYADGAPRVEMTPWGSFEAWSDIVRQCVVWLGLADPMETRKSVVSTSDAGRDAVETIVKHWSLIDKGNKGVTANQIIMTVWPPRDDGKMGPPIVPAELADVADAILQLSPRPTGRSLGQLFSKYRAKRFGTMYLTTNPTKDRTGVQKWVVKDSETESGDLKNTDAGMLGTAGSSPTATGKEPKPDDGAKKGNLPNPIYTDPAVPSIPASKDAFSASDETSFWDEMRHKKS